jgi:2-dehydro-3-deoxyphosphooctonate aldolase (KDO 8-P synthase)
MSYNITNKPVSEIVNQESDNTTSAPKFYKHVKLTENITVGNDLPMVLLGGINVLESRDLAMTAAEKYKEITSRLGLPYVFKASFDKANRSSIQSFRGPGLDEGMKILQEIKETFDVPVITDVHEPWQAEVVAEGADVLQLPAFLCRQTDLVVALAKTGKPVNIKKGQFLAPQDMQNIIKKFETEGNDKVLQCERGTSFGYNNLIVDMLGMTQMKRHGYPVVFDVSHALQMPGGLGTATAGRGQFVFPLALSGIAQGIAGLFLEAHPNPMEAKCDGPCALALDKLDTFLTYVKELDDWIKSKLSSYQQKEIPIETKLIKEYKEKTMKEKVDMKKDKTTA